MTDRERWVNENEMESKDAEIAALKQRVRELEAILIDADSVPTAEQVALDCMAALQEQFGTDLQVSCFSSRWKMSKKADSPEPSKSTGLWKKRDLSLGRFMKTKSKKRDFYGVRREC